MRYADLANEHLDAGINPPCPSCFRLWKQGLASRMDILPLQGGARDAMSKHRKEKVCARCAKMEFIQAYMGITVSQAYPVVYTDWAEAIRLPEGLFWGVTKYPTGGYDVWDRYVTERGKIPFYAFDWDAGMEVKQ